VAEATDRSRMRFRSRSSLEARDMTVEMVRNYRVIWGWKRKGTNSGWEWDREWEWQCKAAKVTASPA